MPESPLRITPPPRQRSRRHAGQYVALAAAPFQTALGIHFDGCLGRILAELVVMAHGYDVVRALLQDGHPAEFARDNGREERGRGVWGDALGMHDQHGESLRVQMGPARTRASESLLNSTTFGVRTAL